MKKPPNVGGCVGTDVDLGRRRGFMVPRTSLLRERFTVIDADVGTGRWKRRTPPKGRGHFLCGYDAAYLARERVFVNQLIYEIFIYQQNQ